MPGSDWVIVLAPQITFVTDPLTPCAGQPFTVSWTEMNAGTGPSGPYTDTFEMSGFNAGSSSQNLDVSDAVEPGAQVTRSLTFTLAHDSYNMNLTIDGQAGFLGNVIVEDCSSASGEAPSDAEQPVVATTDIPDDAPRSDDGAWWWDGSQWQPTGQ